MKVLFPYFSKHRKWCGLTALILIEFSVFAMLNVPANDQYRQYVAATQSEYHSLFSFIFFENLKSSLGIVLLGTIPFGVGTLFITYVTLAGLVSTFKFILPEVGGWKLLVCTLPHGIFEIAAICVSVLLSVLWCRAITAAIIRLVRRRAVFVPLREDCVAILKSVVSIQIPLLLVAALMESTVSSWLTSRLL